MQSTDEYYDDNIKTLIIERLKEDEGMKGEKMEEKLIHPTVEEMGQEIDRLKRQNSRYRIGRWIICSLVVVIAISVLIANLWLPVFKISGYSMSPTLNNSEMVMAVHTNNFDYGDIIAFYYNNKILIKRVIATEGQYVDIQEDGTVFVDGQEVQEPYVQEKIKGECNIQLPYQVEDGELFVMGDEREISLDSRISSIGTIEKEKVIGRVFFRFWPWYSFGQVK